MKKRKSFNCIVGLLSAAILFTSEGMSCLSFAAPDENVILPSPKTVNAEEVESENPLEEEPALPVDIDEGDTEDTEPKQPENPDSENPEIPDPENPKDDAESEIPDSENPKDDAEPEIPEVPEIEETDDKPLAETVSDNTFTINSLPVEVTPVEVKDFDIVDEGGLLISGKNSDEGSVEPKTIYISQGDSRTFSVRLVDPNPADVDMDEVAEVAWTSNHEKIAVNAKEGENGKAVVSAPDAITVQEEAVITATIGEVSRSCNVVFLPKITDVAIVDAAGVSIPESGITIKPGEQKKLGIKISPEAAVSQNVSTSWRVSSSDAKYFTIRLIAGSCFLTINEKNLNNALAKHMITLPHEVTLEANIRTDAQRYTETCKVTIHPREEAEGLRCGDILVTGTGLGTYKATDGKTNEWDANMDSNSRIRLTYKGTAEDYTIYYGNSSKGITFDNNRIKGASRYGSNKDLPVKTAYPFRFVVATGSRESETYSDIYTIHFTEKQTTFTLSPASIITVPGGTNQELTVRQLPDGVTLEDVTWSSGDERIVKIKEQTEKGVMLQFGQIVGSTQITAKAQNHRGQDCYAICMVRLSLKMPAPVFSSTCGSEQSEEIAIKDEEGNPDTKTNCFWLIDKGGRVTISLRSGSKGDIYYTTNGSDPITNGTLYQGPITINAKTKLKACAKQEGYADSNITESEFRIGNPKLTISPTSLTLKAEEAKNISVKLPDGANPNEIEWDSSDFTIASAETEPQYNDDGDETGITHTITAGAESGRCTITATVTDYAGRKQTASCVVNVFGDLQITQELSVTEGETSGEIMLTKIPKNYKASEVTWSVDDSSLGTLNSLADDKKTITANTLTSTAAPNTLTVTASLTMGENTASARCLVSILPKEYTVSFFGWNDKLMRTVPVYRGQSATPPTDEEMNAAAPKGYLFDGWKDVDTWKNVNKNEKVYAKPYVPSSYNITYMTGSDGTNPSTNRTTYTVKDDTFSLKDAVPNNASTKRFAGWYVKEDFSDSPISEIAKGSSGDITLYAKWISAKTGQLRIEPIADQPYTGKALKPDVLVYDGETQLIPGTDYTVSYKNNTKANTKPWGDLKKAPTVTVKGKGNYSGSDTETFQILPQSISAGMEEVAISNLYLAYNKGKKLTVTPTVTWNGKKLRNRSDFAVTSIVKSGTNTNIVETGCTDEGNYTVTVSGQGNFTGTRDISLTVTTKTLMSKVRFSNSKLKDVSWDQLNGKTLKEAGIDPVSGITLKDGRDDLTAGTHYTVSYDENAKDTGTYDVVFTGKPEKGYVGTVTKTFKITGTPITASKLDFGSGWKNDMIYNGTNLTQTLTLSYKKDSRTLIPMTLDQDYTLQYENNMNAGNKAAVVITGINGYTGTVKKNFKIKPYSLETGKQEKRVKISLQKTNVSYEKGGAKPKVNVTYRISGQTNRIPLVEGKDYTVQYKNNGKTAGAGEKKPPTYTVKGKGNFKDSVSETFTIEPQDIGRLSITAEDVMAAAPNKNKGETVGMTGKGKYKSTPKITDLNGKALAAGTDFLKTYTFTDENGVVLGPKDQVQEGSVLTVTVEGTKNYTGTAKVSYRVLAAKMSLKGANISLKKGVIKTYDLEPVILKKEDLVVKLNGVELSGEHYTMVSYMNNRKKGTAKVTIQGVGEYGGSKTVSFNIKARQMIWFKTP